jgi:hypothetical protein
MTTVAGITAKAPRLAVWPRREFQAPVPSMRRGPAEQAAALKRSESHYRRVKESVEASFVMNGGRYL